MARFIDLHPEWRNWDGEPKSALRFDCPCGCGVVCVLPVTVKAQPDAGVAWTVNGEFETLTLSPSIRQLGGCKWHGEIINGEIKPCPDSGR